MAQCIRVSPQPLSIDDSRESVLVVNGNVVSVESSSVLLTSAFLPSVDDQQVVANLKAALVPQVAARANVTLLFNGHDGSGKTCLMEQVVPVVLEALKSQVVSADEAHQEFLNISGTESGSARRRGRASSASLTAATIHKGPTTVVSNDDTRRAVKRTQKTAEADAHVAKYCLLLARMPRDAAAVEMSQVAPQVSKASRPLLPKLEATAVVDASDGSVNRGDERSPSRWRQALERARSPLQMSAGHLTSLGSKNGRQVGEHCFPCFDGERFFTLDPVQAIDTVLKDVNKVLCVSFWVLVEDPARQQSIFHFFDSHDANYRISFVVNCNDLGFEECGQTLVTARDSRGKKLEVTFVDNICDGKWHFVELSFFVLDKKITMSVDDKIAKVKTHTGEEVSAFHDSRPKVGFVGALCEATADGTRTSCCALKGSLMDLTFFEYYSGKKVAMFSLRSPSGTTDSSFTQQPLKGDVPFDLKSFPSTSPVFDGSERFVNVGSVGDLGLMMTGTVIEIAFRTCVTNEKMSLMGVTDSIGKNPGFGVELNTNAQNQLQRYMSTFWIQDRSGTQVRVTSEISSAFDDRWHTLSLRIVDIESLKFKIRLDGRHCDAVVHAQQGPLKDLISYTQFVALGAHNFRGKILRCFKGALKSVSIARLRDEIDEPLATWPLNEGPGAVIALDTTSHGFNGVYYLKPGCKGACFFPTETHDTDDAHDELGNNKGVMRFSNNMVTMACACVRTVVDDKSVVREVLHDLISGRQYSELEPVQHSLYNTRTCKSDGRVFYTIPEECYQRVVPNDYMSTYKAAIARLEDSKHAHFVFVLRLGDASFTVVDLASYKKSMRAVFNPSQLTWTDAVSIFGNQNKINFALNSALMRVDKLLLRCGCHPQLFKRALFSRLSTRFLSEDIITNIITFALLASREHSQLFQVHLMSPKIRVAEALHTVLLIKKMREQDREHAALVIQKLYRWRKAYKRFKERLHLRHEADARKEKIALLRKQYPKEVLEKEKKLALVIVCTEFDYDPSMPSNFGKTDDYATFPRLLESIGFKCEIMLNPSKANFVDGVTRKKQEQMSSDAMLLVHVVAVGGRGCYSQKPSLDAQLSWLADTERSARLAILATQRREMSEFYVDEAYEFGLIFDQMKSAVEDFERKNAKKKKKGSEKAPPAPPSRGPRLSKESALASMAKWDAQLTPSVTLRSDEAQLQAPLDDELFFCMGDTRSYLTTENTIRLCDVRSLLMSDSPRRGEHVLFTFDCLPYPTARNGTFGCGGVHASSGESLIVEYKAHQRLLLTYYLKRCVQGCAVECVRVGKNDPPNQVTVEVAFRYMKSKLDPAEGRFPTRSLSVHWFGEYVGDLFFAHKILVKKDERRKIKTANATKKAMSKLEVVLSSPLRPDFKGALQQWLHHFLRVPVEPKKILPGESFMVVLQGFHFDTLSQHSIARASVDAALNATIPGCKKLRWCVQDHVSGSVVVVHPLDEEPRVSSDPDVARDQKQIAMDYYTAQEAKTQEVEKRIVTPMAIIASEKKLGEFPVRTCQHRVSVYLNITDDETLKLDRLARLGGELMPDVTLLTSRVLSEKEVQELEQGEKLIAIEEARRQAEAKQRLVQEAEARKRAEDELARMLQRKDAIVDKVLQLKGVGGPKPEDLEYLLSVPLPEALSPPLELLAQCVTKDNAETFVVKGQLIDRVISACGKNASITTDARFLAASLKLVTAMSTFTVHAGRLASVLLPPAFSAPASVTRLLPACLEAMVRGNCFLSQQVLVSMLSVVPESDQRRVVLSQLCQLAPSLRELLDPQVMTISGRDVVLSAAELVSRRTTEQDQEFFFEWLAADGEAVTDDVLRVIVTSIQTTRSLSDSAQSLAAWQKLCDAVWPKDVASAFLATVADIGADRLAVVEQLVQRLSS